MTNAGQTGRPEKPRRAWLRIGLVSALVGAVIVLVGLLWVRRDLQHLGARDRMHMDRVRLEQDVEMLRKEGLFEEETEEDQK